MTTDGTDSGVLLQRFGELIDCVGGTTKAGKIAGVARQTIDQWRKEGGRIPLSAAISLVDAGNKTLDWLTGRSPEVANLMQMTMQSWSAPVPEGFVSVPALSVRASAGRGAIAGPLDAYTGQVVAMREDWLRSIGLTPGRTEALLAVGDSMEPTIRDGDMLLVDRSIDRVVDNGIYVLVYGGAVLCKRIQMRRDKSVVLKSENAAYDDETVPADEVQDLIIEGRVRWFGRTI